MGEGVGECEGRLQEGGGRWVMGKKGQNSRKRWGGGERQRRQGQRFHAGRFLPAGLPACLPGPLPLLQVTLAEAGNRSDSSRLKAM